MPLTSLPKKGAKKLAWNPMMEGASNAPKNAFTSAPILEDPDSEQPFTVKVDTSDTGVGTVLSQHFGEKPKLHPVAFF